MSEREFISRFRLNRVAAMSLCSELKPFLKASANGYSVQMQVLSTLRFLSIGSFQYVLADVFHAKVSQATMCRFFNSVLSVLMQLAHKYIKYPSTENQLLEIQQGFCEVSGFSNVVGAIDCTHIIINKPAVPDWFVYINRKNKFSINVQMVCDADLKVLDVVARWPGSAHDAFIWSLCGFEHCLESRILSHHGYLLGNSGYPLKRNLMTPFSNPSLPREYIYNEKHRKARGAVERCFSVIKSRFRALHDTGGTLLYSPNKVCKMVVAPAVLHNICLKYGVENPEIDVFEDEDPEP
ncbi:putative nuclease HARBI1, partial [Stegodyphus mimosarum]